MKELTHAEVRELLMRYKEKAKEIYQFPGVSINEIGSIQLMSDGAFVEAVVWVAKEDLE
jgi:hypothetical protein